MEFMLLVFGLLVVIVAVGSFIGWLWIVMSAFGNGEILWGIGCLVISPLSLIYGIINFDKLRIPVFLMLGGVLAGIFGQIILTLLEPLVS